MRGMGKRGQTIRCNPDSYNHVEFEQSQVRKVVIIQRFPVKMSVDESQPPQAATRSGIVLFKIGQKERFRISDNYMNDSPFPVDQYADLSTNFVRKLGEAPRYLMSDNFLGWNFASVDVFQVPDLISF